MKRYDLMHSINARGSYLCTKLAIPHLERSDHAHVLNISPPLNLNPRWFKGHAAYTLAKYAMNASRKPEIMGEAAYHILTKDPRECTGNFFIDDDVLAAEGITDLDPYAVKPGTPLMTDFFLDE